MDIDDLAVEEILAQQNEILVALQRVQSGFRAQFKGTAGGPANVFRRHNLKTLAGLQDQASDAAGVCARTNGDVFEAPAHAPARAGDGRAKNGGQ